MLTGDLINLKVKPEVSSLDFANGVSLSGFRVPALSTRRTETEVELQDGQTFAIAGLMNNTVSSTMSKVPGHRRHSDPRLSVQEPRVSEGADRARRDDHAARSSAAESPGVSEGLPSAVEPYLAAPKKTLPQPTPYVGSPRYPVNTPPKDGAPRTDDAARRRSPRSRSPCRPQPVQAQPAQPQAMPAPVRAGARADATHPRRSRPRPPPDRLRLRPLRPRHAGRAGAVGVASLRGPRRPRPRR